MFSWWLSFGVALWLVFLFKMRLWYASPFYLFSVLGFVSLYQQFIFFLFLVSVSFLGCIRVCVHKRRHPGVGHTAARTIEECGQERHSEKEKRDIGQCGRGGETDTTAVCRTTTTGQFRFRVLDYDLSLGS